MGHLRRIRVAYVLAAIGAAAVAVALVAALGGGSSSKSPAPPPRQVEIGGDKGPRSCVVRSVPLSETRTLTDTRTATATAPVRVTATATIGGSVVRATVADTLRESATVTGKSRFTLKVSGRAAVCARAASPEEAQRRADAAATPRARRQARTLLRKAIDRAEPPARASLEARTRAEAKAAAGKRLRAALPAARAEAARRATEAARAKAGA